MKNTAGLLSKLLHLCSILGSALFLLVFLALPLQSIRNKLHISEEFFQGKFEFLLFALVLAVSFALLLKSFFKSIEKDWGKTGKLPTFRSPKKPQWVLWFQGVMTLAILGKTIYLMDWPFDNDEIGIIETLLSNDHSYFYQLLHNSVHPIGTWTALLATKVLGMSIWSIRAPAVLFACGFMYLLFKFCKHYVSTGVIVILYGHLLFSAAIIWYFHSLRGYVSMMFFSFFIFCRIHEAIKNPKNWKQSDWYLVGLASFLLPFTHGFGTLFGVFLPFSLVTYTVLNRKDLEGEHFKLLSRICFLLLTFLPFLTLCLGYTVFGSVSQKYLVVTAASDYSRETLLAAFGVIMGASHNLQLRMILLLLCIALFYRITQKSLKKDFINITLLYFMGFVVTQRLLLNTFITGRYLTVVLPLFVIGLSTAIDELSQKRLRTAGFALLAISLVLFPFLDENPTTFQIPRDNYYSFIKRIRQNTKGVPNTCLVFSSSGEYPAPQEALIAETFYFPKWASQNTHCEKQYQVHFGWPWQSHVPYTEAQRRVASVEDLPKEKQYSQIQTDNEGRFFAEIVP